MDWSQSASAPLAIDGGPPVRQTRLPYGRQTIDEDDVAALLAVLRSDYLTTGPKVAEFERAFAAAVGARHAVAVSSGTAALHAAVHALDLLSGAEVIVPAITFAATANCVLYESATPVFADVDAATLLVTAETVEARITPRTRAILVTDYAGQPCDYDALRDVARRHGLPLLSDACHALGGTYRGRKVGSLADLNTFSLHPVKPITAGEGGVITTNNERWAQRMRRFRHHGIETELPDRDADDPRPFEQVELGYNYRLTDIQSALALSQLTKLDRWIKRRQEIAAEYDRAFADLAGATPLTVRSEVTHAYHLYVVRLDLDKLRVDRDTVFRALRAEKIGVQLHYLPVYLHSHYRQHLRTAPGLCPVAESAFAEILSLPIFPTMTEQDVQDVITAVAKVVHHYTTPQADGLPSVPAGHKHRPRVVGLGGKITP